MRDFSRIELASITEVVVREDVSGGLLLGLSRRGEEFQIFLEEAALEELESLLAAARTLRTRPQNVTRVRPKARLGGEGTSLALV